MLAHQLIDAAPVHVEQSGNLVDSVIDVAVQRAVQVLSRPSAFPHSLHHALANFTSEVEHGASLPSSCRQLPFLAFFSRYFFVSALFFRLPDKAPGRMSRHLMCLMRVLAPVSLPGGPSP